MHPGGYSLLHVLSYSNDMGNCGPLDWLEGHGISSCEWHNPADDNPLCSGGHPCLLSLLYKMR